MSLSSRTARVRSCERVTLSKFVIAEGTGHSEDDPVREVMYFYDDDGRLIAKRDAWLEANPAPDRCQQTLERLYHLVVSPGEMDRDEIRAEGKRLIEEALSA